MFCGTHGVTGLPGGAHADVRQHHCSNSYLTCLMRFARIFGLKLLYHCLLHYFRSPDLQCWLQCICFQHGRFIFFLWYLYPSTTLCPGPDCPRQNFVNEGSRDERICFFQIPSNNSISKSKSGNSWFQNPKILFKPEILSLLLGYM